MFLLTNVSEKISSRFLGIGVTKEKCRDSRLQERHCKLHTIFSKGKCFFSWMNTFREFYRYHLSLSAIRGEKSDFLLKYPFEVFSEVSKSPLLEKRVRFFFQSCIFLKKLSFFNNFLLNSIQKLMVVTKNS